MRTLTPSSLDNCLHLVVSCGSPAGMNVYPAGAAASKDTYSGMSATRHDYRSHPENTYHSNKFLFLLCDLFEDDSIGGFPRSQCSFMTCCCRPSRRSTLGMYPSHIFPSPRSGASGEQPKRAPTACHVSKPSKAFLYSMISCHDHCIMRCDVFKHDGQMDLRSSWRWRCSASRLWSCPV